MLAQSPIAGVVSVTAVPSASQLAVVPADVMPSHTLDVPTTLRARRRNGFADPALVRMICGSSWRGSANAPTAPEVSANAALQAMFCRTFDHAVRSSSDHDR